MSSVQPTVVRIKLKKPRVEELPKVIDITQDYAQLFYSNKLQTNKESSVKIYCDSGMFLIIRDASYTRTGLDNKPPVKFDDASLTVTISVKNKLVFHERVNYEIVKNSLSKFYG